MDLIDHNYRLTSKCPDYEKYGLQAQMNRCAASIASNISEGTSKRTDRHFTQYLEDRLGSAFVWETQLIVCSRQDFIKEKIFQELEDKIQKNQSKISNCIDTLDSKD